MRIKTLLIAFAVTSLLASCSHEPKNDLEEFCLQGKVKSVSENQYKAVEKFGKVERGDAYREDGYDWIQTFNTKGNLMETKNVDTEGTQISRTVYEYTGKDSLKKSGYVDYDSDNHMYSHTVYTYTEDGKEVDKHVTTDVDGNVTSSQQTETNGDIRITSTYAGGGKLQLKIVELMKSGFPVETKVYDTYNELRNHYKEEYSNGLRDTTIYYDVDGKGMIGSLGYHYDKYGNVLFIYGQDAEGPYLPQRRVYEYDEHGNWIQCVQYSGDKPDYFIERFIEYY